MQHIHTRKRAYACMQHWLAYTHSCMATGGRANQVAAHAQPQRYVCMYKHTFFPAAGVEQT